MRKLSLTPGKFQYKNHWKAFRILKKPITFISFWFAISAHAQVPIPQVTPYQPITVNNPSGQPIQKFVSPFINNPILSHSVTDELTSASKQKGKYSNKKVIVVKRN
jgi:hypothetical protein